MTFKVGDIARSIESGWMGIVVETGIGAAVLGDSSLIELHGINERAIMVLEGQMPEQAVDLDDVQWFVEDDLKLVRRAVAKEID